MVKRRRWPIRFSSVCAMPLSSCSLCAVIYCNNGKKGGNNNDGWADRNSGDNWANNNGVARWPGLAWVRALEPYGCANSRTIIHIGCIAGDCEIFSVHHWLTAVALMAHAGSVGLSASPWINSLRGASIKFRVPSLGSGPSRGLEAK
ncbi:hypothetical protein KM043_018350 [Ampulex compressa]|nr:hypothetical protein KM043_018350 [Ampulex compressa]